MTLATSPLPPASAENSTPPATVVAAPVRVPRVEYRKRSLENGLTVYSVENHHSPTVAIQVWYHVGSKDDPEGRSGFAHLFEHLMFKSTRNMKSEMMDRLTEDVGGENNAYTTADVTVYHETVPSNYLETLLWAEADRMANLNVDAPNFMSERSVVEEEYRQSVLAPPYGRLDVLTVERSFTTHPYRRDTIGSIPDLETATLSDVQAFHQTFYRPDNATLIVVGDFAPAKLDTWVDQYFGRIGRPEAAIPRVTVKEPIRTAERRFDEHGSNVPLPAVVMTYLTPSVSHPDAEALRIAETILGRGESSRLYQSLVYKQQVASDVSATADLRSDAGLFEIEGVAAGGKTLATVEKSLLSEVERLKSAPVSANELEKARNLLVTDALHDRETNDGTASALAEAAVVLGDPERINTDIGRLQAVTAADVQRVAKAYLTAANRVVIRYSDGKMADAGDKTVATATPAPKEEITAPIEPPQETPPKPATPRTVPLPTPMERQLANGLRVVVVPRPGTGLVAVELAVKAGGRSDPADKAGLADFTAALLTRGTKTRTATQVAEEVEALGGALSSGADWDRSHLSLSVLRTRLNEAMAVFADVARHPAFRADEVERLREETRDDLAVRLRSPGTLARYAAGRVLFGDGRYGHPLGGTPESLRRLRRADAVGFYQRHFHPGNAVLVLGGDVTPEEALEVARHLFGDWKTPALPVERPEPVIYHKGGRVLVVDKPDAGQAAVVLVHPGVTHYDPDFHTALVTNAVLGGGYSSRLNEEIRIKRGLSYGAGSAIDARRYSGAFVASAQTRNEAAAEVASLLREELERLATAPLPASELTPRKASLSGDYARSLETGGGLVTEVAGLAAYDLPLRELNDYLPLIQRVTVSQVKAFAAMRLSAQQASLVIVGDGRKFLPDLRKRFGAAVEVIPAGSLDLNRADLRKASVAMKKSPR
jgi:zinc protease